LAPWRILSDETAVIRKGENGYELFANPWWNLNDGIDIKVSQRPAILKAIFFIRKARKTRLKKMNYNKAFLSLIFGDSPFQQAACIDNKSGIRSFYLLASELVKEMPVFELFVKKDRYFKDRFQELLSSHLRDGQNNH
jgi:hypothetical protein